jgi:hypothetical protein
MSTGNCRRAIQHCLALIEFADAKYSMSLDTPILTEHQSIRRLEPGDSEALKAVLSNTLIGSKT